MDMTPFEQFKVKEFKGDMLLRLVACDILMRRGFKRTEVSAIANKYLTNAHFATIFDQLKLNYDAKDIGSYTKDHKQKGNMVEHHMWNFFETFGYEDTITYFSQFVK